MREGEVLSRTEIGAGGYMAHIGPLLRTRSDGAPTTYGLQTSDIHANLLGAVHGGVLSSLLDQAVAITAWNAAERQPTVTVQMDIRFLNAAQPGDFIEASATLRHATRSLLFVEAVARSQDRDIATASAVLKILRKTGSQT